MKYLRIAALLACVALICAIAWRLAAVRATKQKLQNDAKALRVRSEQGDPAAEYELARLYYQGKGVPQDYKQAADLYQKAADQGYAKAQYGIGFMYGQGKGVAPDYKQALQWYRKSADNGYAKAQYAVGYAYYDGKEMPQDYAAAIGWYRKAADQGHMEAQYALAYMYSQGIGVPEDDGEASYWVRKAADQGDAKAQSVLGYIYSQGRGVPRDYAESARWYGRAARQGDVRAQRALDLMNVGYSPTSKINLSLAVLGCIFLLISSRANIRNREQRRTALAGLVGLLWIVATVYGRSHFGILESLSAVNIFYFGKGLLSGVSIVMLLSIVYQQWATVLITCGIAFVGFNLYAIMHFNLRNFAACPRAFYSFNAFVIGTAASALIFLWLSKTPNQNHNGNGSLASGALDGEASLGPS